MSINNNAPDLAVTHESLHLAKKIVIVDGMIGGGKNLLSSIVSGLPNIEMWLAKPEIEHVCALHHLGHITLDAAKTLINIWTDEEIYNQNMSRNTNFKPSDISSIFWMFFLLETAKTNSLTLITDFLSLPRSYL